MTPDEAIQIVKSKANARTYPIRPKYEPTLDEVLVAEVERLREEVDRMQDEIDSLQSRAYFGRT